MTLNWLFKKHLRLIASVSLLYPQVIHAQTQFSDCQVPIISGASNWYPYAYIDKNNIHQGIGYDVVNMIFADLNIPIQYKLGMPWSRTIRQVNEGRIDVLAANYWTEDRAKNMLMSEEIANESLHVFTLKTNTFIFNEWKDLKNKLGVITRGLALGESFEQYRKNIYLREVNTHEQSFEMLSKGRADYLLIAKNSAQPYLLKKENEDVIMLDKLINFYSIRISFSKKSPCIAIFGQFNQALTKRIEDGSVSKIIGTYPSHLTK
jgi:polar amino acid transport system substrate-binding protein